MKSISLRIIRIATWLVYGWSMLAQVGAIIGIKTYYPRDYDLTEMGIAMALLTAGLITFVAVKKYRLIGLGIAAGSIPFWILTAVHFQKAFPVTIQAYGQETGLSNAELIFRHVVPILVVLLMLDWWLVELWLKRNKAWREKHLTPDALTEIEEPIFSDLEKAEGAADTAKRSIRHRGEKDRL